MIINPIQDVAGDDPLYISDTPSSPEDGDWRLVINGNNLEVQVRISGVWTLAMSVERPV